MGYDAALKYRFTVTNKGAAAAGPFAVDVYGEGSFKFLGLPAGASASRTFRDNCKVVTNAATADSLGQVDESDETNNTASFTEDVCLT
jgi:subtilase family serine protease